MGDKDKHNEDSKEKLEKARETSKRADEAINRQWEKNRRR